jgi:hypothetical protein
VAPQIASRCSDPVIGPIRKEPEQVQKHVTGRSPSGTLLRDPSERWLAWVRHGRMRLMQPQEGPLEKPNPAHDLLEHHR